MSIFSTPRIVFLFISCFLLSEPTFAVQVVLDTNNSKITVTVVHGYKLKSQYRKETRQFIRNFNAKAVGGLRGGHVEVHINNFVYGFTDIPQDKIPHIFPRKNKSEGVFTKITEEDWQQKFQNQRVTFIEIALSGMQYAQLMETYQNYVDSCPYDFALFGKRCASSCYEILAEINILKKKSQWGLVLGIFHPRAFRRKILKHARKKNFYVYTQEGDATKKRWDK